MAKLNVQSFKSIHEIKPEIWDQIVAGRGFQSHHWYQFKFISFTCTKIQKSEHTAQYI